VFDHEELGVIESLKYRFYTPGGWFYFHGSETGWVLQGEVQGMLEADKAISVYIDD